MHMKHRSFLVSSTGSALAFAAPAACAVAVNAPSSGPDSLAGKTLKELREEYRFWLFDDFLPFMDK